ncbi:hypothetical protein [Nonomuraea endophytica]|uniref:hypothetical protein n=1 Tax=Nonomuraea endophytica TaxID=714136 RepID=UPI0037C5BF90
MRFVFGAVLLLALAGCGTDSAAPASPSTFTVTGTVTVPGGSTARGLDGETCVMDGGYSDIAEGAQVVITNAAGTTIALGRLGEGILDTPGPDEPYGSHCEFSFKVEKVPAGAAFYGIEVAHRGRLQYTAESIKQPLRLTLGD